MDGLGKVQGKQDELGNNAINFTTRVGPEKPVVISKTKFLL